MCESGGAGKSSGPEWQLREPWQPLTPVVSAHLPRAPSALPAGVFLPFSLSCTQMGILSLVMSQSTLLRHEVFLVENVANAPPTPADAGGGSGGRPTAHPPPAPMKYLRALAFLRPTAANILHLRSELAAPRFSSYDVLFSNALSRTLMEELAASDVHSLIASVSESYADVFAVGKSLFTLGVSPCVDTVRRSAAPTAPNPFNRTVDGVMAALALLNLQPAAIRYDGGSTLARSLAQRVAVRLDAEGDVFSARRGGARGISGNGLLLIVDRREDPVTPLLSQWTYQAMVHELLGLHKGRVDLSSAPGVRDDSRQVVLNGVDDDFYRGHMYKNFGDLGAGLAALVSDFQSKSVNTSNTARVESVEQMRAFVDAYPAFRAASAHVSKHVTLMAELSRLVEARSLLTLSALEQDLACREAEAEHKKKVDEAVRDPKLRMADRLRLLCLYALRHETSATAGVGALADALASATGTVEGARHVQATLRGVRAYAGARRRRGDVFNNRTFLALAKSTVKRGLGGVENVYTQHEPLLARTLESVFRGRLSSDAFPVVGEEEGGLSGGGGGGSGGGDRHSVVPREVLVFVVGGTTYEEARCVASVNGAVNAAKAAEGSATAGAAAAARAVRGTVVLGGTAVHNSDSFLVEVAGVVATTGGALG